MSFDWDLNADGSAGDEFQPVNRVSKYFTSKDSDNIRLAEYTINSKSGVDRVLECLSHEDVETAMFEGLNYYQWYVKNFKTHHQTEIKLLTHICKAALILGDRVTASTVTEYLEQILPKPRRDLGTDYVCSFYTVARVHARNFNLIGERRNLGAVIASYNKFKLTDISYGAEAMLLLAFNFTRNLSEAEYEENVGMARTLLNDCLKVSQKLPVADEIQFEAEDLLNRINLGLL